MTHHQPTEDLKVQYQNSSNLEARIALHRDYSTSTISWYAWLLEQYLAIDPNSSILELGCGSAAFWTANVDHIPADWEITLTDFSEGMVADAQRNLADSTHHFTFKQADIQNIPFPDASFDCVIANHMLYHVPDIPQALSEVRRVLKPNGIFFAATNGENHLKGLKEPLRDADPDYYAQVVDFWKSPFRLDNGKDLLEPHFSDVKLLPFENSLHVTNGQAIIDYYLSMSSEPISDESMRRLHDIIDDQLEKNGAIDIPKETGLFICRK